MVKIFLVFAGTISLGIGIAGIFIPGLPTTPFLLLTAFLYAKSSDRLYQRLLANKHTGPFIAAFRAGEGLTMRSKLSIIFIIWATVLITALCLKPSVIFIYIHIVLGLIGTFVMAFFIPTKNSE